MRTDDLLKSSKKKAILVLVYSYQIFNIATDQNFGYERTPEFLKIRIGGELFAELLGQLVQDGFVQQKVSIRTGSWDSLSEFTTTVKANKWISGVLIESDILKEHGGAENLIIHLLSGGELSTAVEG